LPFEICTSGRMDMFGTNRFELSYDRTQRIGLKPCQCRDDPRFAGRRRQRKRLALISTTYTPSPQSLRLEC
jgi:hypothetical protein